MLLDFDFIRSVIPHAICIGKPLGSISRWVVDSRKVQQGDIFIAIQGLKTDGHAYLAQAQERGAVGFVIALAQREACATFINDFGMTHSFIVVENPAQAIHELAVAWRKRFSYPVIGITGSAGKTTTKEILANIVREQGMAVVVTQGTQNTLLGISLTILQMKPEHHIAIFEMGISKRGEMARLSQLVMPTIAVITSVGHCHLEGIGLLHDIAIEKRDIFKYLPETGIGIIDGDQPLLSTISYRHPIIKFGKKMVNQIQARKIQYQQDAITFQLKLYHQKFSLTIATENSARIYNILAACAAACALNIPTEVILRGIQREVTVPGRYRRCPMKGAQCTIIDDSYNANPESMKAALEAFERMACSGKKIAVLGDMLELGVNSAFWHRQLGRLLRKVPSLSEVILVGKEVEASLKTVPCHIEVHRVATWQDALVLVTQKVMPESCILVKGSLGIGLGKLVDSLSE